ncbi:MAG TPA: MASE1 domain-containing protein [Candidatus Eisenbacteria bacterium]|nr:MASE1 domain-containing protein [Candidatus Eisenbacteria bacterium]
MAGPVRYEDFSRALVQLALVAVAYWVAGSLSLRLALVHGQVTPIWPPTGIALVAILVLGRRVWPAVFVGALAVNLPIGPSPLGAVLIATGNTLAPLVASELLRFAHFRLELDRLRDAAAIIGLGALVGMTISASIGTSVLVVFHAVPPSGFWPTWAVWWTGDAMGVLLVGPFLLSLLRRSPDPPLTLRSGVVLAALLVGIGLVTFGLFQNQLRLEYLAFPLIMVAAWRYRLRGAAPAALVASGVAIWSAVHGTGPFATENLGQKMITLQVFNVCVALTSFVLATFVATREHQEEMTRLYAAARAASQAKSAFLNIAAHELRTPITVVAGYLSMLTDGSLGRVPESWSAPLQVVVGKTGELNRIVEALLQASLVESDTGPLKGQVVDLREIVEDAIARARPRADLLHADISVSLAPDVVSVKGDKGQLGRVLDNLINNSLSYSAPPARLFIDVSTDSRRAVVRVEDSGIGIRDDEREQVFDRFYRGASPAVVRVPGVGLGLYISRQLAEHHGGSLVVESSNPETGTVFALDLPVATR